MEGCGDGILSWYVRIYDLLATRGRISDVCDRLCMYDTWLHTVRMKYLAGCILLVIPPSIPFLDGGRNKSLRCASIPSVQDVQRSGFDLNR